MTRPGRAHPIVIALMQIRHQAGLTQREVAERARVSSRSVSNWERGASVPSVADVIAVADAVGYRVALVKEKTKKEETSC